MLGENLTHLSLTKPIKLKNATCIYCSRPFGSGVERTTEHVIGRNFVPRGTFANQWNLIANACRDCNGVKSRLEDDISAITMQPDVAGRFAVDDVRLRDEASRKGKGSSSARTRKPVLESQEETEISGNLVPGVPIKFHLRASPQLDADRAFELARYHVRGFFYWITYDQSARLGRFWPGSFAPLCSVQKLDWGNARMRMFQELVAGWDCRVLGIAADEFFKIIIRKSPDDRLLWAWALEWNCNHRLIGFAGDEIPIRDTCSPFPKLFDRVEQIGPNRFFAARIEEQLAQNEDHLFEM
jgi:hypothetical protein